MNLKRRIKGRGKILGAVLGTALFLETMGGGVREAGTAEDRDLGPSPLVSEKQEAAAPSPKRAAKKKRGKTAEELKGERESAMETQLLLEEKKSSLKGTAPSEQKAIKEELELLQRELLHHKKKDRFGFGVDSDVTYDTNPARQSIHHEKGDETFNISPFADFDLSGRKTNLKVELRGSRKYRVKVPEGTDQMTMEGSLRGGRKLGRKTTLALNDRLTRTSQRVQGIDDGKKVTWNNAHQAALSYDLNRKLTMNFDVNWTRTDFFHELFDQDSTYQVQLDPNLFFNLTPKTRITLGYQWSVARVKTKKSNSTTHAVRVGYSGKITGKSSVQANFSYSHQIPNSADAGTTDTGTSSLGYIWQATPKTSLRIQYTNTLSLSVSDSGTLTKTSTRSLSDALSVSVTFHVNRRINTEFSFDGTHSHSRTKQTGAVNSKTQTFGLPFQVAVDIKLADWIRLRLTYTFQHALGDEPKSNENRSHTLFAGSNVSF